MHRPAPLLILCCTITLLYGCHRHDSTPVEPIAAAPRRTPAVAHSSNKPAPAGHVAPAAATPAPAASTARAAANDDSFHVATLTLGSAIDAGYAVTAPATRFADDTPVIYASVAADGPAVTTFKVQNPDRWPAGKYSVEISLNGKSVASRDFEIGKR